MKGIVGIQLIWRHTPVHSAKKPSTCTSNNPVYKQAAEWLKSVFFFSLRGRSAKLKKPRTED